MRAEWRGREFSFFLLQGNRILEEGEEEDVGERERDVIQRAAEDLK